MTIIFDVVELNQGDKAIGDQRDKPTDYLKRKIALDVELGDLFHVRRAYFEVVVLLLGVNVQFYQILEVHLRIFILITVVIVDQHVAIPRRGISALEHHWGCMIFCEPAFAVHCLPRV